MAANEVTAIRIPAGIRGAPGAGVSAAQLAAIQAQTDDIFSGNGSPEGVQPADVGAIYRQLDSDGVTESALWRKESGSSTGGWVPVDGVARYFWQSGAHADADGTTLSVIGSSAWTSPATASNGNGSGGAFINYQTGTVSGNMSGPNGPAAYRRDWDIDATFHVNIVDLTLLRLWVGFFESDPGGGDGLTQNMAAFRFSTAASDDGTGMWRVHCADGATGNTDDTTIPISIGGHYFRIVLEATRIRYYIDGAFAIQQTANLPALATLLQPWCRVTTLTAAARNVKFGYTRIASR